MCKCISYRYSRYDRFCGDGSSPNGQSRATIVNGVSTSTPRPYVPASFRRTMFDSMHSLSHPGIRATQHLLTARFIWSNINSDVRRRALTCTQCPWSKVQHHTNAPFSTFAAPDVRFDHVHLDFVGPLPLSRGYTYMLTCVDHTVARSISVTGITAKTATSTFVSGWISRFGFPSMITTNQGRKFESGFWRQLMTLLGTKRIHTTAYLPIATTLVERFHLKLESALRTQARWQDLRYWGKWPTKGGITGSTKTGACRRLLYCRYMPMPMQIHAHRWFDDSSWLDYPPIISPTPQ